MVQFIIGTVFGIALTVFVLSVVIVWQEDKAKKGRKKP